MSQSAVRSTLREDDSSLQRLQDVIKNAVIVPDIEAETGRLSRLHQWLAMIHPELCWPMDEVREALAPRDGATVRVLSVCSGSGVWAAEMAKEFPHAEVLGVDPDPQRPSYAPPNCRFEVLDPATDDITHLQGMFDVVYCGRLGPWIRYCKPYWARLSGLVKPGGLLLYIAGGLESYDERKNPMKPAGLGLEPDGGTAWWARFWVEFNKYSGVWVDTALAGLGANVVDWLRGDPNLENVKVLNIYVPLGWPGSDEDNLPNREEVGRLVGNSAIDRARAAGPTLLANGMPPELLDLCMRELEAEILEQKARNYTLFGYWAARRRVQ